MAEDRAKPSDLIARYIFGRNQFGGGRVKHGAFVPPQAHPNELSVCITSGLSEQEIWKLCPDRDDGRKPKARADLIVGEVESISNQQGANLNVLIDYLPHDRHANIKCLPTEKSKRRVVAVELANLASLKLPD